MMSDTARAAAGQTAKTTTTTLHRKADTETHAPYEMEVEAVSSNTVHPPPSTSSSASAGWRLPETIAVSAFHEPSAVGEPTMTARERRTYDNSSVSSASQLSGGSGHHHQHQDNTGPVSGANSASPPTRARPSSSSGARASTEGPSVGSAGGPGRHADPSTSAQLIPPSMGAVTRQDSAQSTSKAGASSSIASGNAPQTNDTTLSPSSSSPLVTSTASAAAAPTHITSHNTSTNTVAAAAVTTVPPSASATCVTSSSAAPTRDPTRLPPASSVGGPVGLPPSHTRTNFSNGGAQTAALSAAPAVAAAAASSFPPMAPPPLSQLPPPSADANVKPGSVNGSGGGGTAATVTEDKEERTADPYARPAVALSANLLELYKKVNAQYCAQRRLESPGPKYNNGYDDKDGHYLFLPGEVIFQRYIAQEVLGKGSFGTVIRGFDQKRSEAVAMKITRRGSSFRSQAKLELDILLRLNENPALNHLVVRLLKVFEWQGHLVLVFELLSFNLYQLIKCTRFNGVSLDLVRKFAYQLTHTLLQLESQKPHPIIHCDLKPENILLRNQNRSGIRLIDFGSACYTAKRFHRYIQSRFYRSPEVILFLEYGTAIDRWSLACVLVELHTGVPLFDGRTEAAQLAKFECTLGPIPDEMIAASPKANRFYYGSMASGFQLKEPVPERRSLESVIGVTTGGPRGRRLDTPGHDEKSYREFYDFIARFLRYRPEERMSCRDALQHPFLMPLYTSDLLQQQEREAQHRQQSSPPQQQQQQQRQQASATVHPSQPDAMPSGSRSATRASGTAGPRLSTEERSSDGGSAAHPHA